MVLRQIIQFHVQIGDGIMLAQLFQSRYSKFQPANGLRLGGDFDGQRFSNQFERPFGLHDAVRIVVVDADNQAVAVLFLLDDRRLAVPHFASAELQAAMRRNRKRLAAIVAQRKIVQPPCRGAVLIDHFAVRPFVDEIPSAFDTLHLVRVRIAVARRDALPRTVQQRRHRRIHLGLYRLVGEQLVQLLLQRLVATVADLHEHVRKQRIIEIRILVRPGLHLEADRACLSRIAAQISRNILPFRT